MTTIPSEMTTSEIIDIINNYEDPLFGFVYRNGSTRLTGADLSGRVDLAISEDDNMNITVRGCPLRVGDRFDVWRYGHHLRTYKII